MPPTPIVPPAITCLAELGAYLRQRRKARGYTQQDMSDATMMSPRLIGEIERGRGTVGFERVLYYANSLGVDLVIQPRGD